MFVEFRYVSVRTYESTCVTCCSIWANIVAQIASEAPRIRARRLACKFKNPIYIVIAPNGVPAAAQRLVHKLVKSTRTFEHHGKPGNIIENVRTVAM